VLDQGCIPASILLDTHMQADRRKTQQWEFLQDRALCWYWRRLKRGKPAARSEEVFPSRTDCIADAMTHGYLGTIPWLTRR
jgi:hypothetical protein